jgi:DNA-binding transcriptional regulator LsrR (DeoR family)
VAAERGARLPRNHPERLHILTKVARLYHEQGLGQPEIALRLSLSQSKVSRLLKEAVEVGIVLTVVVPPPGVFGDLEDAVRDTYRMLDVVVVDSPGDDPAAVVRAIGRAGAVYLESSLRPSDRVGVSSWSATLLSAVDAMSARTPREVDEVVQVIGGVGRPDVQVRATHLVEKLARATGARPNFFTVPGLVSSPEARRALMDDPYVQSLQEHWDSLTVMLVGIGSLQPSELLQDSGNAVSPEDQEALRRAHAVGDVCLRFFDAQGDLVEAPLHERVLGIDPESILATPRRVAFAGGRHKHTAIRGALRGGWVNVLVTDRETAEYLAAG